MTETSWTIVLGIVTGLLTSALLLSVKSLFFNSFIPWYRHLMFNGLNLSGCWYSYSRNQKTIIELKQQSEKISGIATVQFLNETVPNEIRAKVHIDDIRTFDISGELSERFLILELKHTDRSRLGIVTFLLQIEGDGTKLAGQGCWYTPTSSEIKSGARLFYRDELRAKNNSDFEQPESPKQSVNS